MTTIPPPSAKPPAPTAIAMPFASRRESALTVTASSALTFAPPAISAVTSLRMTWTSTLAPTPPMPTPRAPSTASRSSESVAETLTD